MDNANIIYGAATKIVADSEYKITDKDYNFFSDFIFIPKNYDLESNKKGYKAVDYSIWGKFLDEVPTSFKEKLEELTKEVDYKQEQIDYIGDALLDAQYEILTFKIEMDLL